VHYTGVSAENTTTLTFTSHDYTLSISAESINLLTPPANTTNVTLALAAGKGVAASEVQIFSGGKCTLLSSGNKTAANGAFAGTDLSYVCAGLPISKDWLMVEFNATGKLCDVV